MVKFVGNRILLGNKIEGCVLRHITVGWCTLHHYCYNMLLMSKLINVNIFWIAVHAFQSYEYIFSPYTYFVCCRFLQFFDAQKCSSLFGCGVRSTSITSSCRLPSTALGRRGTPILTTARGKFLSCSAGSSAVYGSPSGICFRTLSCASLAFAWSASIGSRWFVGF